MRMRRCAAALLRPSVSSTVTKLLTTYGKCSMTDIVIILHGLDGEPDVMRMGNIEGTVVVNFIDGTVKATTSQEVTLIDAATGEKIERPT